ncbi:hypothetical protein HRG_002137 [Hirsutella rhossiliensis]|uniref:Uncharacterized protein n=1 Tax=Hirsutella rhossiliensis TaxID=111463 RepID=A0A9P8N1X7_9HYPO|nr:uncharacterized protein HRG_02137 [Hirsutella rhossiliensis]KAH0966728.1 hypothetical protein HRG_02137 [Hirsutella rhossiliensis]
MAALARSQVFWVSYQPAAEESFDDVLELVDNVTPGQPAFWAGEVDRAGIRAVDVVICTPRRQRVGSVCNAAKWKRKGARGDIHDAKWPETGQTPHSFLSKWTDAMSKEFQHREAGSRKDLFRHLDAHYQKERQRDKKRRVGRQLRRGRGKPSSSPETGSRLQAAPTGVVQVDDGCESEPRLPNGSAKDDPGLSPPRWSTSLHLPAASVMQSLLDEGVQAADENFVPVPPFGPCPPEFDIGLALQQAGVLSWEDCFPTPDRDCDSVLFGDVNVEDISVDLNWTTSLSMVDLLL